MRVRPELYNCSVNKDAMELIKQFGEMWARTPKNIMAVLKNGKRVQGVYILYDGSTPVYIGKGNIRDRLTQATKSKRRKDFWDHFSWYVIKDQALMHDVEVLLLRALPPYFHFLNGQNGNFINEPPATDQHPSDQAAEYITRKKDIRSNK